MSGPLTPNLSHSMDGFSVSTIHRFGLMFGSGQYKISVIGDEE